MSITRGLHPGISAEDYHADPCDSPSLSCGIAKILLAKSPRHAMLSHPRMNPKYRHTDDGRLDLGTVAHDSLLEGGTPRIAVFDPADYPNMKGEGSAKGWTNKAIKEARDAARAAGKTPILIDDWYQVKAMVDAAREFVIGSEVAGCFEWQAESTVIWQEDGIWCRARPDLFSAKDMVIIDYKTTTDANPEYLTRRVMTQMGYDVQAAFYQRGIRDVYDNDAQFIFLFQEIEPPYACSLIGLDPGLQAVGEAKVERAITLWSECASRNTWPAYSKQIHWAMAPAWELALKERSCDPPDQDEDERVNAKRCNERIHVTSSSNLRGNR